MSIRQEEMKVLVACEESQAVCKAFRERGHEAYSCDIIECSGGHPEWHIMQDVLPLLNGRCAFQTMDGESHSVDGRWDLIIAHPPCTHLASSGARHFERKRKSGEQEKAIRFFAHILAAECMRIAVENPVGIISGDYIKEHFPYLCKVFDLPKEATQIVQPWQFALSEMENTEKTTCLWLKGLPRLKPTMAEKPKIKYFEWKTADGKTKRQTLWYYNTRCLGEKRRAVAASKTFPGIAKAMAEQWG